MLNAQSTTSKHPSSLRVFFATEMWERYGFYVVQSLLALYLVFHFQWLDERVYALVGSFTALTYLSPVIGGWIGDHLLGQKKAILLGTVFLFFSYIALFVLVSDTGLVASLSGIAVGTGLLKPNISSLLGNEYPENSSRRESGFTIFYMGITTGIILGTTLPSQLNYYYGWGSAFASAAFGLVLAFTIFAYGIRHYKIADYHPMEFRLGRLLKALGLMAVLWISAFYILKNPYVANFAFGGIVCLSACYLAFTVFQESQESMVQAKQTLVIGILCLISTVFWAFYFQMFLSLTLFISRTVEPSLFGIMFPPPYYVSIQSVGMLVFGYFFSKSRKKLTSSQTGMRTGNKFTLSMLFVVAAYALITWICNYYVDDTLLSPLYIIPAYIMISIAELLLSPVGLSAITVLASRKKVSTMVGIFFVSLGIGAFLSGKLATLTAINANSLSISQLKVHYAASFTELFYILLAVTFVCLIFNQVIKILLSKITAHKDSLI